MRHAPSKTVNLINERAAGRTEHPDRDAGYGRVLESIARTKSAGSANSSPAVPTESVTLRDDDHGSGVWPPSATH
jgi:hypothetical protein